MRTIEVSIVKEYHGNCKGTGKYNALLEYRTGKGPATLTVAGGVQNTTKNRLELKAIIVALEHIKEPCIVRIHMKSQYILPAMRQQWLSKWKTEISQGISRKNSDLLARYFKLAAEHEIQMDEEDTEYTKCQLLELANWKGELENDDI